MMDQDQESDGTNLVIFVVGGVLVLLLLLGAGAFFFLMRVEAVGEGPVEARPVLEPKVEVHEGADPVPFGEIPVDQAVQPKNAPVNEVPGKVEKGPVGPPEPPPPKK
jgi:hypothetical protein